MMKLNKIKPLHHLVSISLFTKSMSAPIFATESTLVAGSGRIGLNLTKPSLTPLADSLCWRQKTVSNGSRVSCMKTWSPMDNKKFETLSYLPPLSDDSVARQIDYMVGKGWVPCLEFDQVGYVKRVNSQMPGYYDGRYWTMWKLPMFGSTDASQVLMEIEECKKTYPDAYIRCLGFDNVNQGQSMAFIVHKPLSTTA